MSIAVRKVTITTTETHQIWSKEKIMKRLATYMATLPGCSISTPMVTDGHRFYVNLNLNGGSKDQFSLVVLGSTTSPTCRMGLCEDGYVPDLTRDRQTSYPNFSSFFTNIHENVYDHHDFYFFISDSKLICFSDPVHPYMIFTHDGSLKTFYQIQTAIAGWYDSSSAAPNTLSVVRNSYTGGVDSDFSDVLIRHSASGACEDVGGCRDTCALGNNYNMPSDKLLKFSKIELDNNFKIVSEITGYPVNMTGDLLLTYSGFGYGDGNIGATYKKIQVDGKNYIHIGGAAWMPYDSITETTISAD